MPLSGDSGIPELKERAQALTDLPATVATTACSRRVDLYPAYVEHLHELVDVSSFRPYKVVMDAANGVAGKLAPLRVRGHGRSTASRCTSRSTARSPTTSPTRCSRRTAARSASACVAEKADLGIAWDGDADRCFFIDEDGEFVPGDFVTALLAEALLIKNPGAKILYDLRASRAVPDVITANGGVPLLNRVGHAFFKQRMRREGGLFGGEVSRPLLLRRQLQRRLRVHPGAAHPRPALAQAGDDGGAARAAAHASTSSAARSTPWSTTRRRRWRASRQRFADGELGHLDGVSVDYPDWHFNVRSSNTEPLLRLNLGADSQELMEEKRDLVLSVIREG